MVLLLLFLFSPNKKTVTRGGNGFFCSLFLRTDHHPAPMQEGIIIPLIIAISTVLAMSMILSIKIPLTKDDSLITIYIWFVKWIYSQIPPP
jgi:hypothetical protein